MNGRVIQGYGDSGKESLLVVGSQSGRLKTYKVRVDLTRSSQRSLKKIMDEQKKPGERGHQMRNE